MTQPGTSSTECAWCGKAVCEDRESCELALKLEPQLHRSLAVPTDEFGDPMPDAFSEFWK